MHKRFLWQTLEHIFPRGIQREISGISLKLPIRFHRYYPADYEANNVAFINAHVPRNGIVLDIGAQIGLMTKLFADLVGPHGKVHAFEPTPLTFLYLQKTIAINNIADRVSANNMAISEETGTCLFNVSDFDIDAANSLMNLQGLRHTRAIPVQTTSIDRFITNNRVKKIDFIKIDVEGAELKVLLGARETIAEHKPTMQLALHPQFLPNTTASLEMIYDLLDKLEYQIWHYSRQLTKQEFVQFIDLFDVHVLPRL